MTHAPAPSAGTADPPGWRAMTPNILTVSRVVLAVGLFALLTARGTTPPGGRPRPDVLLLAAAVIFGIAAATDAADGHLARRWGVVSKFGRVMDPFADKLLVLGAFVFLAGPGFWEDGVQVSGVAPWMAAVILGRELLVTSIRAVVESSGGSFAASRSGKLKMVLQSAAVPAILILAALAEIRPGGPGSPASPGYIATRAIAWATVLVTVWSGVPYARRAAGEISAARPSSTAPPAPGPTRTTP